MNNRRKAALETKKTLLETAERLFTEKGFDHVSVEDITRECDLAKGTFYIYFKHKTDIIQEIGRAPFERIETELGEMQDRELSEKLQHYFILFIHGVQCKGINICRQWIRNVIDPGHVSSAEGQKLPYDVAMFKRILQKEIECGTLRPDTPVDDLAWLVISELYGMMTCWCMSDGKFEPEEWAERFIILFCKPLLSPYLTEKRGDL